jgi:hypothetical protein
MNDLPKIIIPSYLRANLISNLTLRYLEEQGYPSSKIYIFVASEVERDRYASSIPRNLYGQIVVGVLGLKEQRNFISLYFPENEVLIQLDDDVKGFKMLNPDETFLNLVDRGLQHMNEGGGLFGVLPNDDGRKMKARTTTHLTHIIGSFFIIRNHKNLLLNITEKEDFERSILYFLRYNKVGRYQGAGVITKYTRTEGGLQASPRQDNMLAGMDYLSKSYPGAVKRITKAKGSDITLNWRYQSPVLEARLCLQPLQEDSSDTACNTDRP